MFSIIRFGTVACAAFLAACGGGTPFPAAPTTQAATTAITAVVIEGPQVVPTDSNVTYIATAVLGTGNKVRNVRPTVWSTSDADIATINSAGDGYGELTARRPGMVTITATHQGQSGTLMIEVRETGRIPNGAHLEISYSPNPAGGVEARCPGGFDPGAPTWTFTETIAETQGVGFTQETFTFNLYTPLGAVVYSETEVENYRYEANSAFSEEFCTSLFGIPSGFYTDIVEGIDDRGNRMAFGGTRLRLLPVGGESFGPTHLWAPPIGPLPIPPAGSRVGFRSDRRRIR